MKHNSIGAGLLVWLLLAPLSALAHPGHADAGLISLLHAWEQALWFCPALLVAAGALWLWRRFRLRG